MSCHLAAERAAAPHRVLTKTRLRVCLPTFPGIVFLCDQTELAVERTVADAILVDRRENAS
jgi:hypothetical protein